MISKDAIKRGYNRGDYVVGAHTPPFFANEESTRGETSFQTDPIELSDDIVVALKETGAKVSTDEKSVINGTRDWWARSMIAETSGNPPTPVGAIVEVSSAEQVQAVMRIAAEHKIPVTASAGRSNVTGAALPLRGGIVLDMCKMNKIVSYDEKSQIVEVEAGMFGDVFEKEIQEKYGVTTGHWPSSFGVSAVGGWVACRGAGQLSTRYGKIEDMVWGLDVVLANGDLISVGNTARAAVGPDLAALFVGSEGTLGIITTVRLKVHRLPDYSKAIAYGFESFADGLEACREIMQREATPAVMRLYDNLESGIQFDLKETNVLLLADEGEPTIVDAVLKVCQDVCTEMKAKELDHDFVMERWLDTRYLVGKSAEGFDRKEGFVSDTLEMTGKWADLPAIYDEVVQAIDSVPGTLAGSAHQSHAYVDAGCIYFSMRGIVDLDKRADWYRQVWDAANDVVIRHGASLSHHHGVGMLRARFMERSLGEAFDVLRRVKKTLDPDNILNPGKLGFAV